MRNRHVASLETASHELKIAAAWIDEALTAAYLDPENIRMWEDNLIRAERAASESSSRVRELIRRIAATADTKGK